MGTGERTPSERLGAIAQHPLAHRPTPNLIDYAAERAAFSWDRERTRLDGLPGGGLNIAHEAVVRHARGDLADKVALRFLRRDDRTEDVTFADLDRLTARFANAAADLGLQRGDRVFALLGRTPELYVTALGALRSGLVFCPLFSAFGPEPVWQRVSRGDGRLLVTTAAFYRKKVAQLRERLPGLDHVLIIDADEEHAAALGPGVHSFAARCGAASDRHEVAATSSDDMALLHFTSGTTGTPKGAVHVHEAVLAHHVTARYALDLHPDDVFWCTADPGWVTGTSYGIIAPLSHGVTTIVDESDFDADRWYRILAEQHVTVWYTAPTAIRMLMKIGSELASQRDLSALGVIASVGEPLAPDAVLWGRDAFGLPIHDNWWQTETGGIMVFNDFSSEIRPGSMGRPMPGIDAALVRIDADGEPSVGADGEPVLVEEADVEGVLALRSGWPSMFRGYLHEDERYRSCFVGSWYLSGDLVTRDADGWFWFVGRADDVIKSAGHLVGPFEVESVLVEHPAVAEAAVIGKPDPVAGNIIKAFVVLRSGHDSGDATVLDIIGFARKRLGPAVAPREVEVVTSLPHTRSGKTMRRLLKARELGLPEGDLSTLEAPT
ncbi:MAG: acetate--CoA ligase [Microthrixaceae bacterium]